MCYALPCSLDQHAKLACLVSNSKSEGGGRVRWNIYSTTCPCFIEKKLVLWQKDTHLLSGVRERRERMNASFVGQSNPFVYQKYAELAPLVSNAGGTHPGWLRGRHRARQRAVIAVFTWTVTWEARPSEGHMPQSRWRETRRVKGPVW